ncbi:helicase associated domain-containing protein [Pseudarthrobacter sp. NPDC058362]|uniref:helicase associated domain-containing protein n=1 Tax=Pseudarthrobacter sp. NPDC058362 TaxID=3346458 RepID=UPI00365D1C8D
MTTHRTAPHPEWVLMYRKGLPSAKISGLCGVPSSTVRFHLQKATDQEPGLREEHRRAMAGAKPGPSRAALRNLSDLIALHQAEERLPATSGATARERTLAGWLARCRREATAGTLSSGLREGLSVIPGWDGPSARELRDEARWRQRFQELTQLRAGGGDWPRHQKTADEQERALGLWLHGQRISARHGRMDPAKVKLLDSSVPGWREGRGHRGGQRSNH